MRFKDRVVVITGAGSGIGAGAADGFAAEGGAVVLVDMQEEAIRRTAERIGDRGGQALALAGDVGDFATVERQVGEVVRRFGRIDVLINSAGIVQIEPVDQVSPEQWRRTFATNVDGVFFWSQAVVRASMLAGNGGAIVNVASISGLVAFPGSTAYVATKHAVVGITKAMAVELGPVGVRVNAICPGITDTEMTVAALVEHPEMFVERTQRIPLRRRASVADQVNALLYLASSDASGVTGVALPVDGGTTVLASGYSPPK